MKIRNLACITAALLAPLFTVRAQSTIADWTFDNSGIVAPVLNPVPSSGANTSTAYAESIGMTNSLTPIASVGAPDVIANPAGTSGTHPAGTGFVDSTPALPDAWRVRAKGASPNTGNGWSDAAPVATQGAQFHVSTAGYYDVKLTFDITATTAGEGYATVQYTTDGVTWNTAPLAYPSNPSLILNNSTPGTGTNGIVIGSYLNMVESGTFVQVWFTNVTADFTGINAVNNNTNFAVRIVNACTGTNCVSAAAAALNNTSGNWSLDNVAITGNAVAPITAWTFENYSNLEAQTPSTIIASPAPTTGSGVASCLGMTTSYTFADSINGSDVGSISSPDVLIQAGSSTPTLPDCWRIRGQTPGNGWNSQAAIGTQGAEFDVSTLNYNTILVSFDLYFTTQGEAKMQVQYTTDGWNTWSNGIVSFVQNTTPTFTNSTYIYTNDPSNGGSVNTVTGTYFWQTNGQGWFNKITLDLSGVASVTNNPNFGIRVVNAATGADVLNPSGGPYNNFSGNWRFDNVVVSGQFSGPPAPTITADPSATVDHPFTNTFTPTPSWQYSITNITVNGTALPAAAYNTNVASGKIVFTPSASALLQSSGTKTIVYYSSAGYIADSVTQPIGAGVATQIGIQSQPVGPTGNGGTLVIQPAVAIEDQYGNGTTNPYGNVTFTASVGGSGGWTLGGSNVVTVVNGVANFYNLSATVNGSTAVSSAVITLTATGTSLPSPSTNTVSFSIGAPATPYTPGNLAVMQIDTVQLNTTFTILELNSSNFQSVPVNSNPVNATGTNALRESSSGSTGRLAISGDGSLLCFAAFLDGNATTPDETANLNRAVGTLNFTNGFTSPVKYTVSTSSSQARAACTADDINYIIADKNGVFINSFNWATDNTRACRVFGGVNYLMSATSPKPAVYAMSDSSDAATPVVLPGIPTDTKAQDFYMVQSGVNGSTFDTLYIMDQVSATAGTINKFCYDGISTWNAYGSFTTTNGGDGLFAMTNSSGTVYLYYTTGGGGTPGNSVVQLTDAGGYDGNINITATNTIYTTSGTTSLKGLVIAPVELPAAPTATTLTASNITSSAATLAASVNPNNAATSYWFNYGTTTAYGSSTVTNTLPAGYVPVLVTSQLTGLTPSTTYHYQVVVTNALGATNGLDATFTTLAASAATPPLLSGTTTGAGGFQITFSNTPGLSFSVLGTNDLTAPRATWPVVGSATESPAGSGNYQFTNSAPTNTQMYYILRQP